jgi:hypothetical protein
MTGKPFNITVSSCVKEGRMDGEDGGDAFMNPLRSDGTLERREKIMTLDGLPTETAESMVEEMRMLLLFDMIFSMMSQRRSIILSLRQQNRQRIEQLFFFAGWPMKIFVRKVW